MKKIIASAALTIAFSIIAVGQTSNVKQSDLERRLIVLSSKFVGTAIGREIAEVGNQFTLTSSGPMPIAHLIKRHDSVRLTVRNIKVEGVNAVVEGQIRFKSGSSEETDLAKLIKIRIKFRNQNGLWKVTAACLGECQER